MDRRHSTPRKRHCLSNYSPRNIHLGLTKALPPAISPKAYPIHNMKALNTLAVDIWQPHVLVIFLGIMQIGILTSPIPPQTYQALSGGRVRGVIYGIDSHDPEEKLLNNISGRTHWIVAARRMGKKTAVIILKASDPHVMSSTTTALWQLLRTRQSQSYVTCVMILGIRKSSAPILNTFVVKSVARNTRIESRTARLVRHSARTDVAPT
ncbi:hypothetical protein HPB48_019530 [Haemaphysalis longicornis]|uniref:Uncharacterized protein n=1 Tax=Haemaphysalis longicornis TaxID=44386 RepID=A0A9J6GNH4_HAELO|nr:hypothetical protein HPB48_019530 [Haemaphysalis longicornis]